MNLIVIISFLVKQQQHVCSDLKKTEKPKVFNGFAILTMWNSNGSSDHMVCKFVF